MDQVRLFRGLDLFRGKRNTVLTIFFPPNSDFQKDMDSLRRQINMIKHGNKKWQILQVIDLIFTFPQNKELKKIEGNGKIILAGCSNQNEPFYYELYPPNKLEKFEYYYDFFFYMDRVREIWYQDVMVVPENKEKENMIKKLEEGLIQGRGDILLGEGRINSAVKMGLVKELYRFTEKDTDDGRIEAIKNKNAKIIKIVNPDMEKKYGPEIGVMWFSLEQ